ncbi:CYTH and CHAD domain-containing protein [Bosea sp. BIWAKO-01]|uniref:CYTH and CHAD domain-containing protein n=1 Tax=Bosea sp. BIWAKO-01 TaxID=506668 RepID=UPI000852B613|nr:CYTH and CHAD domain-containing protein [Bosea sp. BIWAKO-01]GAU85415.1 adenylate cyclase [Bosea sp. BIWAKO-01]
MALVPMMPDNREVELKLIPMSGDLEHYARAAKVLGTAGKSRTRRLNSVYFDTPKLKLRRKGYSLRIRHDGRKNIQTVKSSGAGAIMRGEWECVVTADAPSKDTLAGTPVGDVLGDRGLSSLRPVFSTQVSRRTFVIMRPDATVELALDIGEIQRDDRSLPICEAELELASGTPAALLNCARDLASVVPSLPVLSSKGERGFRLMADFPQNAVSELSFDVTPDMSTKQAIQSAFSTCFAGLFDNFALLAAAGDGEALHQARVCIRRIRALASLFEPALQWRGENDLSPRLRWLTQFLGASREVDVLCETVLATLVMSHGNAPGVADLRAVFEARSAHAREAAIAYLKSPAVLDLSLDLLGALDAALARTSPTPEQTELLQMPIGRYLRHELRPRLKSFLKRCRHIERLDPPEQHEARVRAKKLRYMIDPFGALLPRRSFSGLIEPLQTIQRVLGDLNDRRTGEALLRSYVEEVLGGDSGSGRLLFAAGLATALCRTSDTKDVMDSAASARSSLQRADLDFDEGKDPDPA